MTIIDKGFISSFEGENDRNSDKKYARVLPCSSPNMPTRPLVIAWHLRGDMGNLKVNDSVWFALADDLSGIIFERADGEWTGTIPGDVKSTGKVTCTDLKTDRVASQNSHVHSNGNQGANTGAPTG